LSGQTALSRLSRGTAVPDSVVYGVAGGVATLFHDAIMTPAEGITHWNFQQNCTDGGTFYILYYLCAFFSHNFGTHILN
jgi:hypothetical protein